MSDLVQSAGTVAPQEVPLPEAPIQRKTNWRMVVPSVLLLLILVYGGATTEGFFSASNFRAILAVLAVTGFAALGATLVMLGGFLFSMSAGVTAAGSAMVFTALLPHGLPVAIVGALAIGALSYVMQGFVIAVWGANPIVVTIGAGSLQIALANLFTNGSSVRAPSGSDSHRILAETLIGVPVGVFLFAGAALVLQILLSRTQWGRYLYNLGSSEPAAYAAGIPVTATALTAFGVAGVCTAMAGVLQAAAIGTASIASMDTLTFDAVAAAVVGGAAVNGGHGSIWRTVIGVVAIATITDLLLLRGYSTGTQILATGLLVVVFVVATGKQEQAR